MELNLKITFDEDKLREIINEAVARLKAEGYIWRDSPPVLPDTPTIGGIDGEHILGRQDGISPKQAD